MGCSTSRGVQVSQQPRRVDSHKSLNSFSSISEIQTQEDIDFEIITSGTQSICRIQDTSPIVCLGKNAFPIVTSNLFLDVENPTNILLPVVAASRYGYGISFAIGHISTILEDKLSFGDSDIFFSSIFHWALEHTTKNQNENGEIDPERIPIIQSENEGLSSSIYSFDSIKQKRALVIGFPQDMLPDTKKFIHQFSLGAEFISENKLKSSENGDDGPLNINPDIAVDSCLCNETFFSQYIMILASSNVSFDKFAIQNYISKGGIFAAFYIPPSLAKQSPNLCLNIVQYRKKYSTNISDVESAAFYILNDNNISEAFIANSSIDQSFCYAINETLIQTNLAFTYCSLHIGDPNSASFKIQNKFNRISNINFPDLIQSYINHIKEIQEKGVENATPADEDRMDELVTDLRFYLMVIDSESDNEHYGDVKALLDGTWDFLSAGCPLCNTQPKDIKSMVSKATTFPYTVHIMCIVLITQMLYAIPITAFSSSPLMEAYLGDIPEIPHENNKNGTKNSNSSGNSSSNNNNTKDSNNSKNSNSNNNSNNSANKNNKTNNNNTNTISNKNSNNNNNININNISENSNNTNNNNNSANNSLNNHSHNSTSNNLPISPNSGQIHKLTLTVLPFAWTSTGLYLPRGAIATIRVPVPLPFLHVQIGCQHTSLLEKSGAWLRWPVVVMSYSLSAREIEFSSPFGGIVYIVSEGLADGADNLSVDFEFEGLLEHPYKAADSAGWVAKDSMSPWGELEGPHFIITLPTFHLKKFEPKIEKIFGIFTILTDEVISFTSCQLNKPFRIVFDTDILGDDDSSAPTYPVVLQLDQIDDIFCLEKPSNNLLMLVKILTTVSLREGCIDAMTEEAVALVSACSAVKTVWPDFNPLEIVESLGFKSDFESSLFRVLWDIHVQCDRKILPRTIAAFQVENNLETQEDLWMQFVTELCNNGKKNFTGVLKKARPIPMNISSTIQSFPDYSRFTD